MPIVAAQSQAPDFTLPRNGGTSITLSDLRPQKVVLYFYPKDDTPSCTQEGIDFSALSPQFSAQGTVVIGISKDSASKHDRFCKKHGLSLILASDEAGQTCEDYGVWQEKKTFGKTYMGIVRSTFLIAPDGSIARVWSPVSVKGHAQAVLEAAQAL
jgi:thioredoxin-dependent peroxiredoxin